MKGHYIYFIGLFILLVLALMLPFNIYEFDGTRILDNAYDEDPLAYIYLIPAIIATALLVIPNRVTALIGCIFYLSTFVFAAFVYYILSALPFRERVGAGAFAAVVVCLAGLAISVIHTVRLFRKHQNHKTASPELLDDLL